MKYFKYIIWCFLVLALVASCDGFSDEENSETQTEAECLANFFGYAQSGDFDKMYLEMHPDGNRANYASGTTFDGDNNASGLFESNVTYSITDSSSNPYTVTVNPKGVSSFSESYTFKEDGDGYWLILEFTYDGDTTY
jgi:hypothetical protein